MNILTLVSQVKTRVLSIRKGTWIALGIGLLVLFGLLIWGAVATLSWLWGQAPTAADAGKRAAGAALEQVEQVAPGMKERVADWLPKASKNEPAVRDVSGPDIGPVARYPGMARDYYSHEGNLIVVHYVGRADFQSVLDHYTRGFAAAGWRQEVIAATREAEQHRYILGKDQIEFRLASKPNGRIQVELKGAP